MSSQILLRTLLGFTALNLAATGTTYYTNNTLHERTYEENEARMDELEGTLRGHIGLIEESLERIEGVMKGASSEGGFGKGMGKKAEELYGSRGKDGKDKGKKKED